MGGAQRHLEQISPALIEKGWKISIYCISNVGVLGPGLAKKSVDVIAPPISILSTSFKLLKVLYLILSIAKLFIYLLFRRPAIVHCFLPEAYILGVPLAFIAGIKHRFMSRRSLNNYQFRQPMLFKFERHVHRLVTAVLCNSKKIIPQLMHEGFSVNQIFPIYNGVSIPLALSPARKDEIRSKLDVSGEACLLVTTANLIPYKGHSDLLNALAQCATDKVANVDWHLLVIGKDAGILQELIAEAKKLKIERHVSFVGLRGDAIELMQASDIGVLVSHEEGFSNAVIEGMACGLPMLVTDVGGNGEAVIDGENGYVVAAKDIAAISKGLSGLISDADTRHQMGRMGQKRADKYFSVESSVDNYHRFYQSFLSHSGIDKLNTELHQNS